MAKNKNNLTELQQAVADTYLLLPLEDRNPTEAYRAVRPKASDRTAQVEGLRILSIPDVIKYVDRRIDEMAALVQEEQNYTMQDVVGDLIRLKNKCMGDELITRTKKVKCTAEETKKTGDTHKVVKEEMLIFNPAGAKEALKLLAESFGGLKHNVNLSGKVEGGALVVPMAGTLEEWQKTHFPKQTTKH